MSDDRQMILRSATKDLRQELDIIARYGYQRRMVALWLRKVESRKVPVLLSGK